MMFLGNFKNMEKKWITVNRETANRFYKENIIFLVLEDNGERFIGKRLTEQ